MSTSSLSAPHLSVLVFSRDDAHHLQSCLQCLIDEPPSFAFEVIVFENASEDDSIGVLERFAPHLPLTWIAESVETSFSIGNNRLLREADGELVLFLNPDTRPSGTLLEACAELFKQEERVGLVSPCLRYPDGSHQATGWHLPSPGRLIREHAGFGSREFLAEPSGLTEVGWLMGCFLMAEREFITDLGGFDEEFWFHGTDLELCSRVHNSGRRVLRLEGQEMVHVGHQEWERPRRLAVQAALTQWLEREYGSVVSTGAVAAARLMEALR